VWIDSGIPESVKSPGKFFDESTLFWRHEALHRQVILDYPHRIGVIESERDLAEKDFVMEEGHVRKGLAGKRAAFTKECFDAADRMESAWLQKVKQIPLESANHFYYSLAWKKLNEQAGMPQ
jgi:hypothetical protein